MADLIITRTTTLTDMQTQQRFKKIGCEIRPLFLGCRFFEDAPKSETPLDMLMRILQNRTTDPTEIIVLRPNGAPDDWWREAIDAVYAIANAQMMFAYWINSAKNEVKVVIVQ